MKTTSMFALGVVPVVLGTIPLTIGGSCNFGSMVLPTPPVEAARISPAAVGRLEGLVVVATITDRSTAVGTRRTPPSVTIHVDEVLDGELDTDELTFEWGPLGRSFVCGNSSKAELDRIFSRPIAAPAVGDRFIFVLVPNGRSTYAPFYDGRYFYDQAGYEAAKVSIAERRKKQFAVREEIKRFRQSWTDALDTGDASALATDKVAAIVLAKRVNDGTNRPTFEVIRALSPDYHPALDAYDDIDITPGQPTKVGTEYLLLLERVGPSERLSYRVLHGTNGALEATPQRIKGAEAIGLDLGAPRTP